MFEAYCKYFTDAAFWAKLGSQAVRAGREVVHKALCLYYAALSPATPMWAKVVICGALGYFIFPVDAVPDMLPVVGYGDDLGTLVAATAVVAAHIRPEHSQQADETLAAWFG